MKSFHHLDVSFYQFYLADKLYKTDTGEIWNEKTSQDRIAVGQDLISIGTECNAGRVEVVIALLGNRPSLNYKDFDQVAECSLETTSGKLVLFSPESIGNNEIEIPAKPGIYSALIFYKISSPTENYTIYLWPGTTTKPIIHQQYSTNT